jgi:hypothetical protein
MDTTLSQTVSCINVTHATCRVSHLSYVAQELGMCQWGCLTTSDWSRSAGGSCGRAQVLVW